MTDRKELLISLLKNNGFNFSMERKSWIKSTISVQVINDKVILKMIGPAEFYDIFDFNLNSKKFDKHFKNFQKRLNKMKNILERHKNFDKKITFLKANFGVLSKSPKWELNTEKNFIKWNNNKKRFETSLIIPEKKENDIIFNEIEILITEFGKIIPIKDFSFTTKTINNEKVKIINKEFEKIKNLFHELKEDKFER